VRNDALWVDLGVWECVEYVCYTIVSSYSTFNTSPTTTNLLRIRGEYLTKSLDKLEKYSIFIS